MHDFMTLLWIGNLSEMSFREIPNLRWITVHFYWIFCERICFVWGSDHPEGFSSHTQSALLNPSNLCSAAVFLQLNSCCCCSRYQSIWYGTQWLSFSRHYLTTNGMSYIISLLPPIYFLFLRMWPYSEEHRGGHSVEELGQVDAKALLYYIY